MVMDDLAVKPMSTISSISLLNTFNIKDVGVLEETTVTVDMAEGLKLLRASLHSKTVLTDVFLSKGICTLPGGTLPGGTLRGSTLRGGTLRGGAISGAPPRLPHRRRC
ncbi:unnamed protein product [Rhodiola kirilowii]